MIGTRVFDHKRLRLIRPVNAAPLLTITAAANIQRLS